MACNQTLTGIANDCAPSMGGIVEAMFINFNEVTAKTVSDGIITAITLATGKYFRKYYFRRNTGSMSSTRNINAENGNNYVSTELVLQFSRMDTAKRLEIEALSVSELCAIVKDANGKYWFLGNEHGLTSSAGTGVTGTAAADLNGYTITFADDAQSYPLEVSASIIDTLLPSA